jgi:hypothetical protein
MERFQYELLAWISLPEKMAEGASHWYRGAGWYMNERDTSDAVVSVRLIAPAETEHLAGARKALNACGIEGWEVAAYDKDPKSPPLNPVTDMLLNRILGVDPVPPGACFLLKRRGT